MVRVIDLRCALSAVVPSRLKSDSPACGQQSGVSAVQQLHAACQVQIGSPCYSEAIS